MERVAKRRIHKFNFDQEKMVSGSLTHVALVDHAANLTEALVMKSTYITQTTSVEDYDEDGSRSSSSSDTTRMTHYEGDDYVTVTQETVNIVRSRHPIITVI